MTPNLRANLIQHVNKEVSNLWSLVYDIQSHGSSKKERNELKPVLTALEKAETALRSIQAKT